MPEKKHPEHKDLLSDEHTLPDAELEVLGCIWQHREATSGQIRRAMHGYRPMKHGAVTTLLSRLYAKGLITREKAPTGKAFIYKPTHRASAGYRRVLRNLLHRIFGGDSVALVASLFETHSPTRKEVEGLKRLLDDLSKEKGRK